MPKWYTMLEQLDVYSKTVKVLIEGPIIVGKINDSDGNHPSLRNWATHQRNSYTQSKTCLLEKQKQALNEINFCWNIHEARWQKMLNV